MFRAVFFLLIAGLQALLVERVDDVPPSFLQLRQLLKTNKIPMRPPPQCPSLDSNSTGVSHQAMRDRFFETEGDASLDCRPLSTPLPKADRGGRFWDKADLAKAFSWNSSTQGASRFQRLFDRLNAGKRVIVGGVGSSIIADGLGSWYSDIKHLHAATPAPTVFNRLHNPGGYGWRMMSFLNALWPHPGHLLVNAGTPTQGVTNLVRDLCMDNMIPEKLHLAILEPCIIGSFSNGWLQHTEAVVRRLYQQPGRPAIILLAEDMTCSPTSKGHVCRKCWELHESACAKVRAKNDWMPGKCTQRLKKLADNYGALVVSNTDFWKHVFKVANGTGVEQAMLLKSIFVDSIGHVQPTHETRGNGLSLFSDLLVNSLVNVFKTLQVNTPDAPRIDISLTNIPTNATDADEPSHESSEIVSGLDNTALTPAAMGGHDSAGTQQDSKTRVNAWPVVPGHEAYSVSLEQGVDDSHVTALAAPPGPESAAADGAGRASATVEESDAVPTVYKGTPTKRLWERCRGFYTHLIGALPRHGERTDFSRLTDDELKELSQQSRSFHGLGVENLNGFALTSITRRTKTERYREKFGWRACNASSAVDFVFPTRVPAIPASVLVTVSVAYLESYRGYGVARIECVEGCSCTPATVDAHTTQHHQVTRTKALKGVSQAERCVLRISIDDMTRSAGHCFKVMYVKTTVQG